jgi:hypothetical protein
MSFCRIPYAVLQGILEPSLIPSREFGIPEQGIMRPPRNLDRARQAPRSRQTSFPLIIYIGNPAPNGDKRHADLRSDLDIYPAPSLAPPASVLFRFLAADTELSLPKPAEPVIL